MGARTAAAVCSALFALAPACLPAAVAQPTPYAPPRTPDGKPDLGGVWSNAEASVTITQSVAGRRQTAPFEEPWDNRLPFKDRASAMAWREKYAAYMSGLPAPDFTRGVDSLPNRDRCLMAANAAAPPMTSQGYNDAYQIVQTPFHVAIAVEMMDELRIVPVFQGAREAREAHQSPKLQRWTGDSVGWWEADTLVVETVSVNARQAAQSAMPTSQDAMVVERFSRVGEDELHYEAEVTDPVVYLRPWKIEYSFHPVRRIWEYACHEGNYGMAGILTGARKVERARDR